MSAADVLEKTTVVGFETSIKNGIIELPIEYKDAFLKPVFVEIRIKNETKATEENLERAFAYGNSLAKKYGFTEEDLNNEINMYRKEKAVDENSY
jgi:hypothetical protein